jgi:glycosyltransferase involved in cell wall biosynthesis
MTLLGVPSITMRAKVPLTICYLGRRGGGAKITSQIYQDLKTSETFSAVAICIRSDNELAKEFDQSKEIFLFENLLSIKTLVKVIRYALLPKSLLKDMRLSTKGSCLVPMISPLGLIIESILKFQGVKVIRLLHDFERHPGDKWPPNLLIRHIIGRSNFLITLSNDVANKVLKQNPKMKVAVYPHPNFQFSTSDMSQKPQRRYILFIGRIRKYKGIENLLSAYSSLQLLDIDLVIAGEGKLKLKHDSRIKLINRWLEEYEITGLVKDAEVVVFPYVEASQSGLLPYCTSMNKKIVITPLSGLLEQVFSYDNVVVASNTQASELAVALRVAIEAEIAPEKCEVSSSKNIEDCLLESGFFSVK